MHWLKLFTIISIVGTWSTKALADGKVTALEAMELGAAIAGILGIPTEIDMTKTPKP